MRILSQMKAHQKVLATEEALDNQIDKIPGAFSQPLSMAISLLAQ
jgi:hypothetical protein